MFFFQLIFPSFFFIITLVEGYGDYPIADQLFLGWGLIGTMLFFAILINAVGKKDSLPTDEYK